MKRLITLVMLFALCTTVFAGCSNSGNSSSNNSKNESKVVSAEGGTTAPVTLNVFSTYAGNDGNAENYQNAIKDWQSETGNTINDTSATADETVKAKIRTDFSTGSEPDVLFYFTGADAQDFLDKVVSVSDIRKEYADYADNMNEKLVPIATDGNWYAVPMTGYWENLYVNKAVLEKAGVAVPDANYTWSQFLADCQKIKDAGLTPIAASFVDVPHYWWEFSIYNNDSISDHMTVPASTTDTAGKAWVQGMQDIKDVYDKGYFPANVLSEKDEAIQELFYNDQAAFLLDGSWKANAIKTRCSDADGNIDADKLANFTVVNFPGKDDGQRKSTDMITGMSSGWYITKKAWADPAKREAAVNFVKYMTTDELCSKFAGMNATALKNGAIVDESKLDSLDKDIQKMLNSATGASPAVQDIIAGDARNTMFQAIPQMVAGKITPEELIKNFLDSFK